MSKLVRDKLPLIRLFMSCFVSVWCLLFTCSHTRTLSVRYVNTWSEHSNESRNCSFVAYRTYSLVCSVLESTSELWCLSGGKREDYQNCFVLYCVLKLCTAISTLIWAVLTVLWIGFCHTGPFTVHRFIGVYLCVFVSYWIVVLLWVRWGGPDGIEVYSLDLSSFSALTLLVRSFDP